MSDLEEEFKQAIKEYQAVQEKFEKEARGHIDTAREELRKAVVVSDKYGVPFYSPISFIGQTYTPESPFNHKLSRMAEKLQDSGDEDKELDEALGYWEDEYYKFEYEGWKHSAAC